MSNRVAGSYTANRVEISLGLPVLPGGQAVEIPGLPPGLTLPHTVDGRATDAFLSVTRETPTNSKVTGSDGEVIVAESLNRSGQFAITLQVSSLTNIVLSSMLALWESGTKFFFPVTVIDLDSFGSLYEANECWIQGWPEAAFAASPGSIAWVLEAGVLRMSHGGRGVVGQ